MVYPKWYLTLEDILYQIKCYCLWPIILLSGGFTASLQNIDGYYYYPAFVCPPGRIKIAREKEWSSGDLLLVTYPKSGTHFGLLTSLLVLHKGEFPPKADLHRFCCAPEFSDASNCRSLDEPSVTQPVRVLETHMPQHHLKYSETAKYLCIIRDPVNTLASQRRMDFLTLGPIVGLTLNEFLKFHLYTRETGWLDHVLGWWSIHDKPNVLVLTYEMMIKEPENCVRKLAKLIDINLTQEELRKVVMCMDKKWALENIDPYLTEALTPLSPPASTRHKMSKSGFIVDSSKFEEKLSIEQETEIRLVNTQKIRALILQTEDPSKAANALSFFEENREYFTK